MVKPSTISHDIHYPDNGLSLISSISFSLWYLKTAECCIMLHLICLLNPVSQKALSKYSNRCFFFSVSALGMGLCVAFIALVRLPSLKVSTLLLVGLLIYDVFWVSFC